MSFDLPQIKDVDHLAEGRRANQELKELWEQFSSEVTRLKTDQFGKVITIVTKKYDEIFGCLRAKLTQERTRLAKEFDGHLAAIDKAYQSILNKTQGKGEGDALLKDLLRRRETMVKHQAEAIKSLDAQFEGIKKMEQDADLSIQTAVRRVFPEIKVVKKV